MKKIITFLTAVFILASGSAVFAADPVYTDGTVTVNESGYKTVLVVKGDYTGEDSDDALNAVDPANIVYIDQADNVYTGAMTFLLRSSEPGFYTVKMGSAATSVYTGSFRVLPDDKALSMLAVENTTGSSYDISFVTSEAVKLKNYNSIKIAYDGAVIGGFPIDYSTIDADVLFGVRIKGVDAAQYSDSTKITLYLSGNTPTLIPEVDNTGEE